MTVTTREEIRVGEMVIRFLLEGDESGGSVAVFEFDVPAGAKVAAAHSHDGYDETIYGLEGMLTWTLEGHFDNTHDADAKALAIVTPGILGPGFFREVAAVLDASAGGPPDVVALGEVMRRHGLTPAPPTQHPSES